jgi:hypothetical protein
METRTWTASYSFLSPGVLDLDGFILLPLGADEALLLRIHFLNRQSQHQLNPASLTGGSIIQVLASTCHPLRGVSMSGLKTTHANPPVPKFKFFPSCYRLIRLTPWAHSLPVFYLFFFPSVFSCFFLLHISPLFIFLFSNFFPPYTSANPLSPAPKNVLCIIDQYPYALINVACGP